MAEWSIIRYRNLFPALDIAAEHYHPDKFKMLEKLSKNKGTILQEIVRPVREPWDPSKDIGYDLRVYDLGAAQKNILQEGDAQEEERVSTKKIARGGDIIVSRLRSYLKQIAYIPNFIKRVYLSTEYIVLRSKTDNIAFLVPFLLSNIVQTILRWSQDGSEHPRFNERVLMNLNVPTKVMDLADVLNSHITHAEKALSRAKYFYDKAENLLLEELNLSSLNLSLTLCYERRYSEARESMRIDAEYFQPAYDKAIEGLKKKRFTKLRDIARLKKGRQAQAEGQEGRYWYASIKDILGFAIEPKDKTDNEQVVLLKPGEIALAITGATIGKVGINESEEKIAICGDLLGIETKEVSGEYMQVVMDSPMIKALCHKYTTGATNGHLAPDNVAVFPIPIISENGMERIEETVKEAIKARKESQNLIDEAKKIVEETLFSD